LERAIPRLRDDVTPPGKRIGAGDRIRTGDVQLGKLTFYH
jgi:hypothetical protein